MTFSIIVWACF